MNWLTLSTGAALMLDEDHRVLATIARLVQLLYRDGRSIAGEGALPTLLMRLSRGDHQVRESLVAVARGALGDFASDLDVERTIDSLQRFARSMLGRWEELGILTCRWNGLDTADCVGNGRVLHWPGLDRFPLAVLPESESVQLMVSGADGYALKLEAVSELPPDLPLGASEAVRVGLYGKLRFATGLSIPIRFGSIGLDAGGDAESRIDWYFHRGNQAFVAVSFAEASGALVNPFDLPSVANALDHRHLAGVRLESDGGLGLGGSLKISAPNAIPGLGDPTLGAQLRFRSSRRGGFLISIYSSPDPLSGRRAVRADIHRTKRFEDSASAAVGLTFDLSGALSDLRSVLLADERVKGARTLLGRFEQFIPPSGYIGDFLGKALERRIESPRLRVLLGRVLGSSGDASETDRLCQRLTAAIDARSDLWQAPTADLASCAAQKSLANLPLGETERSLLQGISRAVVERSLEMLSAGLDTEIARQVDTRSAIDELEHALGQAEAALADGFQRADTLTGRVKVQIERVQRVYAAIARALEHSGEVKLNARWRSEERRSEGSTVEQSLLFRAGHPDAGRLYKQALTGSLDDIFDRVAGAAGAAGDGPVSLISGTLQEVASVSRQSGIEITLLDFQLQGLSLLDANVLIETDPAGNIRVCTRQRSRRITGTSAEREVFEAVNVFELASAKQTRRMSLSLSLSQIHKRLEDSEIRAFFSGLSDARIGLLSQDQVAAALAQVPTDQALRAGEVRAWMELDEVQLRTLLRLPPLVADLRPEPLNEDDARQIYDEAIDAILTGLQVPEPGADYNNLKHFLKADPKIALTEVWVKSRIGKYRPHRGDSTIMDVDERSFERFQAIAERAHGLVRTIRSMRAIYLSKPGSEWTPEVYRKHQERINGDIIGWVRGEFAELVRRTIGKDAVNPYLLAYFKVIAELIKAPSQAQAGSPLLASIVVPSPSAAENETEILLVSAPVRPLPAPAAPGPPQPLPGSAAPTPPDVTPGRDSDTGGRDSRRIDAMPRLTYPMDDKERTRTYLSGGREYGAARSGRRHAGCDMLAAKGTRIRAMADGKVVRQPYHFYEGTYAIEIEHPQPGGSIIVRYGEVGKGIPQKIKRGALVKQGDVIAYVGKLKRTSMLHLEMYGNGKDHSRLSAGGVNKYHRRSDIMNPTTLLDDAPTFAGSRLGNGGGGAPGVEKGHGRESGHWDGIVDALKTSVPLNVRREARFVGGEDPELRLPPNTPVEVLGVESGGAHPFGSGNLWLKIQCGDRTGYVVAYFIKTDLPLLGVSAMEGLPTAGHVSGVETILNIRSEPGTGADVLYTLPVNTPVTILSQHSGDEYSPGRNDWVKIRPLGMEEEEGYAAAFYISPGETGEQAPKNEMDVWERVLIENVWPGRKSGGREVSERAAKVDVDIVRRLTPIFSGVANKYSVPAALLAGIASRESGCGRLLRDGWGDRGNAFGIMQIDKNSHNIRNRSEPAGHEHVEQAAGIFHGFLEAVCRPSSPQKVAGWEDRYLLQGATAAYNFGLKHVKNKEKIDIGTTNDDYGGDVLARAKYFYNHPELKALRD